MTTRFLYAACAAFVAALVFTSCAVPIAPVTGAGSINLDLPQSRSARFTAVETWRVAGSGPATFSQDFPAGTTEATVEDLAYGEWLITIDGLDSSGASVVHASQTVTIGPGSNTLDITMDWTAGALMSHFDFNSGASDSRGLITATATYFAPSSTPAGFGINSATNYAGLEGAGFLGFPQASASPVVTMGGAVDLTMADGKVDLGESFTLAVWLKPENPSPSHAPMRQIIISSQPAVIDTASTTGNSNVSGFTLGFNTWKGGFPDGKLVFTTGNGSSWASLTSSAGMTNSMWQHVAVCVDRKAGTVSLWLNGVEVASASDASGFLPDFDNTRALRVGALPIEGNRYHFTGAMDDWRVYAGVLDEDEIRTVMGQGAFAGGKGTAAAPFKVATPEQLNNVRYANHEQFIQTSDINLGVAPYISWTWKPIGNSLTPNHFNGVYDGDSYAINGLSQDSNAELGLFGWVGTYNGQRGNVRNLTVANASMTNSSGSNMAGILVSHSQGADYINCHVSGSVGGTFDAGGGLIGTSNGDTITRCSMFGSVVNPSTANAGGLVGTMTDGRIEQSLFMGTVVANNSSGGNAGGLAGSAGGTTGSAIYDSCAFGSVAAVNAAGLVGNPGSGQLTAVRSYAALKEHTLTGGAGSQQGLFGASTADTYCYWDSGIDAITNTGMGGSPLDRSTMNTTSPFTGWNVPGSPWVFAANLYPRLSWQTTALPRLDPVAVYYLRNTAPGAFVSNMADTASPSAFDGTYTGVVSTNVSSHAGKISGLIADANTNNIHAAIPATSIDTAGDYAISLWFRGNGAAATVRHALISQLPSKNGTPKYATNDNANIGHPTNFVFYVHIADGDLYFEAGKDIAAWDQYSIRVSGYTDNKWHHAVAQVSGSNPAQPGTSGTMQLYVDGALAGTTTRSASTPAYYSSAQSIIIGAVKNGSNTALNGLNYGSYDANMGAISLFNRSLSETEVMMLYMLDRPVYQP